MYGRDIVRCLNDRDGRMRWSGEVLAHREGWEKRGQPAVWARQYRYDVMVQFLACPYKPGKSSPVGIERTDLLQAQKRPKVATRPKGQINLFCCTCRCFRYADSTIGGAAQWLL